MELPCYVHDRQRDTSLQCLVSDEAKPNCNAKHPATSRLCVCVGNQKRGSLWGFWTVWTFQGSRKDQKRRFVSRFLYDSNLTLTLSNHLLNPRSHQLRVNSQRMDLMKISPLVKIGCCFCQLYWSPTHSMPLFWWKYELSTWCVVLGVSKTFTIPYKHFFKIWWNLYLKDDETVSHKCVAFVVHQNQLQSQACLGREMRLGRIPGSWVMAEEIFIWSQLSIPVESCWYFLYKIPWLCPWCPALYLSTGIHNAATSIVTSAKWLWKVRNFPGKSEPAKTAHQLSQLDVADVAMTLMSERILFIIWWVGRHGVQSVYTQASYV